MDMDPPALDSSIKPMERRKKRKALDKDRKRTASSETQQPNKIQRNINSKVVSDNKRSVDGSTSASYGGAVLPEFHIGVFKDLASTDGAIREAATQVLVNELQEIQKAYDRLENKDTVEGETKLEAEKDDGLNNCAPSLRYAVRRLIRGVSSSRSCARQGFALGLTVLLGTVPSIRVDSLFKLVVELLEISSSMKGQEAKDCLLGRLFTYGALARSGRLIEEWRSNKNTPYIREFIKCLISLATKKRYLQEPAVSIIIDLVEKLPAEAWSYHIVQVPELHEWFVEANDIGNPDALLLALKLQAKVSDDGTKFGKLLPTPFCSSQFFSSDHLSSLINSLKESTFCQPRVHSVWPVLVDILLPNSILHVEDTVCASNLLKKHKKSRKSSSSEEELEENVRCFCEVIVEGSLLMSSHDRKHLAFDILHLLIKKLPASLVPIVLSHKVVQCLMDILSTKNSWLYKIAEHFLKALFDWVGHDDIRRVAVIVALQKHSSAKFDSITRTKTVKDLMAEFKTKSGCLLFIQNLANMFIDEGNASEEPSDQSQTTDDNSDLGSIEDKDFIGSNGNSDFLKSWIVESLPTILKHLQLDPEAKFRVQKEILKFLAVQGLFYASLGTEVTSFELQEKFRWPKSPTSSSLCRMCIEQLQVLLANAQKGEGTQFPDNGFEQNNLGSYFMRFLDILRNIPSVALFRSLSSEDEEAIKSLQGIEMSISKEERNCGVRSDARRLDCLRYLIIQLLLQVLLRPGEHTEAVSDLVICCEKVISSDLRQALEEDDVQDDGTPKLMDVLVDTLLSLLPHSSAPMRSAIEQVFKYFCHDIAEEGLLRMLRVIKKNLKPARHMCAESEDDNDDDDDFIQIEDEDDVEDEKIDRDETAETAESDDQMDDAEVVEVEKKNDGIPEASDEEMDDDAMFRMDAYIAHIVKGKKNHAGSETALGQLMLFKLRVLSLLEIYLHENPGKPEVLMVYSNLARAFVDPHTAEANEQLGQRIWGILQKQIFKGKDYPRDDTVELSTLESLLEWNLKLASKPFKKKSTPSKKQLAVEDQKMVSKKQSAAWNRHKMISSLAQTSTYWILKIIDARHFSELELQRVFDIFKEVFIGYLDSKKFQIKSEFLREVIRRRPWVGRNLFGFILERCVAAKSDFRRVEALSLVIEIMKSLVSGDNASKKIVKENMKNICNLIKELVANMPEKHARQAEVRKFCNKVFQIISTHNLNKTFLKSLPPDSHAAVESKFGELFKNLKKL